MGQEVEYVRQVTCATAVSALKGWRDCAHMDSSISTFNWSLLWSYRSWGAKLFIPIRSYWILKDVVLFWVIITIEVLLNGGCIINLTCSLTSPLPAWSEWLILPLTADQVLSRFLFYCLSQYFLIDSIYPWGFFFFLIPRELIPQHCSPLSAPSNLLVSFQFSWSISLDSSPLSKPLNLIDLDRLDVLHSLLLCIFCNSLHWFFSKNFANLVIDGVFLCFAYRSTISCSSSQHHINNQRCVFTDRNQQVPAVQAAIVAGKPHRCEHNKSGNHVWFISNQICFVSG